MCALWAPGRAGLSLGAKSFTAHIASKQESDNSAERLRSPKLEVGLSAKALSHLIRYLHYYLSVLIRMFAYVYSWLFYRKVYSTGRMSSRHAFFPLPKRVDCLYQELHQKIGLSPYKHFCSTSLFTLDFPKYVFIYVCMLLFMHVYMFLFFVLYYFLCVFLSISAWLRQTPLHVRTTCKKINT